MTRPLAFAGVVYFATQMLAILLPPGLFYPLAVVFAIILVLVFTTRKAKKYPYILVALCIIPLALAMRGLYYSQKINPIKSLDGRYATVSGVVREVIPLYTDTYKVIIKVNTIDGKPAKPEILAQINEISRFEQGDIISLNAQFSKLPSDDNMFYAYTKGVFITLEPQDMPVFVEESKDILSIFARIKNKLSSNITSVIQGENGHIAAAMSVGDKTELSRDTTFRFRCAGISHMLVVSGMHIAAISGIAYFVARKIFGSRKISAIVNIIVTILFMLLTGLTPSVVRAGVVVLIVCLAILLTQVPDTLTSIGIAIIILCVHNPFAAIDMGLLLSFAATLGVIAASTFTLQYRKTAFAKKHRLLFKLFCAICVPLGASIATFPVLILFGGAVSLPSVFFNLVAVPLLPFIALTAFGLAFFANVGFIYPIIVLLDTVCTALISFIVWLSQLAAAMPYSLLYVSGISALLCVLTLYVLTWCAYRYKIKRGYIYVSLFLVGSIIFQVVIGQNIVSIEPMIISGSPAVIIYKEGKSAIVYSANIKAANIISESISKHNVHGASTVIDLRRSEHDADMSNALRTEDVYVVEDMALNNAEIKVFDTVKIYIKRQKKGITACIDVSGYKIELSSGKIDYANYGAVDMCIAGRNEPESINATSYICSDKVPRWAENAKYRNKLEHGLYRLDIREGQSIRRRKSFYGYE